MDGVTLVWAWSMVGQRWHLRAGGAELALCGVGKRGLDNGKAFDPDDIYVLVCVLCLAATRVTAPASRGAAGDGRQGGGV